MPPGVGPAIPEEDAVESSSEESLGGSKDQLVNDVAKPSSQKGLKPQEIMLRANSLKKAVRQVIEEAGKGTHKISFKEASNIPAVCIMLGFGTRSKNKSLMVEDNKFASGKFELSPVYAFGSAISRARTQKIRSQLNCSISIPTRVE